MRAAAKPAIPRWNDVVKDAKRDVLLQAARDEFVEKGLEGATMRGIAARTGCTTGAIYPLFDSKESIYAALLDQSLLRLDACVAQAADAAVAPADKVEAACSAFLTYYLAHPFEINLGLYAFRGLKRQGVGKRSDAALNNALRQVLMRIALPFSDCRGVAVAEAQPLVTLLLSQMIGAIVLQVAGRLKTLDTDAHALLRSMLDQLLGGTISAAKPKRR